MKRCTMCGKKLDTIDINGNFSFQHRVGYGSKHDGDIIYLKLCCNCFDRAIDSLSMMSKERIVFSPQELSESYDCYEKRLVCFMWKGREEQPSAKQVRNARISSNRKRCRIKQQAQKCPLRITSAGNADRKCDG